MFFLTLTPLKDGGEEVNPELPVIKLHSHPSSKNYSISNEVKLGRKGWTKITNRSLPRKLLTLKINKEGRITLTVHKDFKRHSASMNGAKIGGPDEKPLSLTNGAILSLLEGNRYQYRILLKEDTATKTKTLSIPNKRTAATSTDATYDQQTRRQACEELMCSICMDILCHTVAMNPCGHLFCGGCIRTTEKCYTCRTETWSTTRIFTLDSHILKMVKTGSFSTNDAKYYLNRSGNVITDAEMERIIHADADANFANDISHRQEDAIYLPSNKRRQLTSRSVTNISQPRNQIPISTTQYIITIDSTDDEDD